jgi:hypothetical protein
MSSSSFTVNCTKQKLDKVIHSIERVPDETKAMIFQMANSMNEMEIIRMFNQETLDMFACVIKIVKDLKKEAEYKIPGYKVFFDNAIKINAKMPIDKFTLTILEYAAEIYAQDEDCFLNMSIPDSKLNVGNEFGLLRSELFKKLWIDMNKRQRDEVTNHVLLLTTYAHTHLYKTLLKTTNRDILVNA